MLRAVTWRRLLVVGFTIELVVTLGLGVIWRDRQVSEPKPWVGVLAPAEIHIESVLDTSRSARVANLVAQLPEVLRLAGSGVFGAWYRGVMYLGTTTLNARWTSKWGPRQVASGSPDVEEIAERLQSLINH
jgi:hypothetical protein